MKLSLLKNTILWKVLDFLFAFPKSVVGKQQRSCQHHWFKKFTWLHYDIETDSVLCFLCVRAEKKRYVTGQLSKELAWKKAPKCFTEHEQSKTDTTAKTYQVLVPRCADVGDMLSDDIKAKRLEQRKYLIKVMECVQYESPFLEVMITMAISTSFHC